MTAWISRLTGCGFNTQPPEGGWKVPLKCLAVVMVSTHSRPKAAGIHLRFFVCELIVSTHSRPKAAGVFRGPLLNC